MKTRVFHFFLLLFFVQGAMAQLTSLGLVEEVHCAVKPYAPLPLLEVSDNYLYASTSKGLYRYALDGAEEWEQVIATDEYVSDFAVRGDTVIVSTVNQLYISYDGGTAVNTVTMERIYDGFLAEISIDRKGAGVGMHPYNAKHVYVAHSGCVAYTGDGGLTWSRIKDVGDGSACDLSYNPLDTLQIVGYMNNNRYWTGHICMSLDGGKSFESYGDGQVYIMGILFHPTDKNKLIAYGDVYYMTNGSPDDWNRSPSADTRTLMDVVYDPYNPETLYGVTAASVKRSTDGGFTWSEIYNMQGIATSLVSIAIHDRTLYLCTSDKGVYALDLTAASMSPLIEDEGAPVYYDLQGRKVTNPTRGIYIKDGKKVAIE